VFLGTFIAPIPHPAMKASIKRLNHRKTKNGYPIIIYLSDKYSEKRIRIGFSTLKNDWNDKLSVPKKSHPEYYHLHRKIQELNTKLVAINYQCNSIDEALEVLNKKQYETFFEICARGLHKSHPKYSALVSFEKYYPNIKPNEITTKMVDEYVTQELKSRKPSGVDSYIRSLRAVFNANFNMDNPFRVKIKIPRTIKTVLSDDDIKLLQKTRLEGKAEDYKRYFLIQFYLGGIDFEVLHRLKKSNIINGRVEFNRNKGQSDTFCSNKVFDCAKELFFEGDYIIDAHRFDRDQARHNYSNRFQVVCEKLGIAPAKSKTARYTFINRGKLLLIDQRIVGQIVGHTFKNTTSLYENNYPLNVQDEAHKKIINV